MLSRIVAKEEDSCNEAQIGNDGTITDPDTITNSDYEVVPGFSKFAISMTLKNKRNIGGANVQFMLSLSVSRI